MSIDFHETTAVASCKVLDLHMHTYLPCLPYPEKCQASVVFGLSKNQYITEVVESNNPEWNQEALM